MLIRGKSIFHGLSFLLIAGLLLAGCIDQEDYNFDRIAAVEVNPSFAAKLIHGRMSITDLNIDSDEVQLKAYPDGLLYFYFQSENESASIADVIELPDVSLNTEFKSPIDLSGYLDEDLTILETSFEVDLGLKGGEIDSILYSQFPVDFVIESTFEEIFDLTMTFPSFSQDGEVLSKSIYKEESGNSTQQEEEQFSDFIAALNTLDPAYNKFPVDLNLTLKGGQFINITKDDVISITLDIKNQGFIWVKGYFEPTSRIISDEDLSIDLFNTNFTDAEYDLAGAKLSFEIENEFGVPITLDFKTLHAVNEDGDGLPIEINPQSPFTINSPEQVGESATSTITVTNPVDIFKFKPSGFEYAIEALINDGIASGRNFMAITSKNTVKFTAEMPLWGNADGIALRDTFDIDLNELSDENFEIDPSEFIIKAKIENAYPVDIFMQLVLLDENYNYLDLLLTEEQTLLVQAAETNDTGIVKTGVFDDEIVLEDSKINNLFDAKYIAMVAYLRTFTKPDGTRPNVKFFEQGYIETDMGINTRLNVEVKP